MKKENFEKKDKKIFSPHSFKNLQIMNANEINLLKLTLEKDLTLLLTFS